MIEARGLTKHFGRTVAVDDLSFTVRPGLVTGFLGPNGAGKSTTMRLILGLDRPTKGAAFVNGHPYVKARAPMREVGALLDAKAVHGGRTARAHLLSLAQSNGLPARRVNETLELTGLTAVAKKRIGGFSLGMSQRLGIAAALLGDPQVVMFDEPVNGLDPEGIIWIRALMKALAANDRTVFVSSHLMNEISVTADHLIVIGKGKLLADMSTKDSSRRIPQPRFWCAHRSLSSCWTSWHGTVCPRNAWTAIWHLPELPQIPWASWLLRTTSSCMSCLRNGHRLKTRSWK